MKIVLAYIYELPAIVKKHMIKKTLILSILFIINCYSQNDKFDVSHGISIIALDTLDGKIQEIKYENCRFVSFPIKYSQKIYGTKKTYFIPDSLTVSYINENISKQYCFTSHRFMENFYKEILNDDGYDKKALRKSYKEFKKNDLKNCQKYENDINVFDKQLIGYINDNGEKIILIQMIDFREDPYKLKSFFEKSWISGWHGWFETNIRRLHFHLKNNKFTINEEI